MTRLNASFRALWLGQAIANLADAYYIIAIVTLLYDRTGSAALAASVPVLRVGAQMTSGFLAPLVMERFPLRRILIASQSGQTVLLILLSTAVAGSDTVAVWFLPVFAASFLDGWTVPARNAMVPRLVPADSLVRANGWLSTTDQTVMLLGWSSGGLLVAWAGSPTVLWTSIALFTLSCLLLLRVRDPVEGTGTEEERLSNWHALKEGWTAILENLLLRRITLMDLVETASGSVWIGAIILVFVKEVLHRGEDWWGWINASYYAGTMLGGLLVVTLSRLLSNRLALGMFAGAAANSLLTFLFALVPVPALSLLLCLLMGPCYQLRDITQRTLFQRAVSPRSLPKVFAAHGTLMYGVFGLSVFLVGAASDQFGVRSVYLATGVMLACSALTGLTLLRPAADSEGSRTGSPGRGEKP